jgi:hypothetical protein
MANVLIVNSESDVGLLIGLNLTGGADAPPALFVWDGTDPEFGANRVEFVDSHRAGLARVANPAPCPIDVAFVEWGPSLNWTGTDVRSTAEVVDAYVAAGRVLGVKIFILTTYLIDKHANATLRSRGAERLITMPFSPFTIAEQIDRVLAR